MKPQSKNLNFFAKLAIFAHLAASKIKTTASSVALGLRANALKKPESPKRCAVKGWLPQPLNDSCNKLKSGKDETISI